MNIEGRTAVVTGAASGIGLAIAAEIREAFSAQAPMTEDARRYEVNAVIAELLSDPS